MIGAFDTLAQIPRCIHAELLTHRVFSRNSASSRAIPSAKLIEDVEENPFVWGKNRKGKQPVEGLTGPALVASKNLWAYGMHCALYTAQEMAAQGARKQIVNRVLEQYSLITALAPATQWETSSNCETTLTPSRISRCSRERSSSVISPRRGYHSPLRREP
jgi:hypothetical protein